MKKLFVSMLIMVFLLLALAGAAFASSSGKILEVPDVKIIMDGKLTQYKDVPICIGQYTLLPLRELLINLGVPNDDEHIVYDNVEKSVTIKKDQIRIYLAVGNQTATVNGQPVKLQVAPAGYDKNQRIYIPFRFVAEALGKKVVWDGSANAILVCDAIEYDSIKQILERSDGAMKLVEKCRQTLDADSIVRSGQNVMRIDINAEAQIDKRQKRMYMKMAINMLGVEMKTDSYYTNNTSYIQNPINQTWQKKTHLQSEYNKLFANQSNTITLKVNEPLCAGLTRMSSNNPDEILLKGDIYLKELFEKALTKQAADKTKVTEEDVNFDTFHLEISLNSNTYLINSMMMNVGSAQAKEEETVTTDVSVKVQYDDYNGDFQIIVPEDVIKKAVEIKSVTK